MLFFQDQYKYLVDAFAQKKSYSIKQFANQELVIKLQSDITDKKCIVVGSLTTPQDQALSMLLLLHTLKIQGACSITLYSPYLGYQRQDNYFTGRSQGILFADAMLFAAGVHQIVTLEPHCAQLFNQLQVPVFAQNVEQLFIQEIAYYVSMGFTFVYPDHGSAGRSNWIHNLFPSVWQGFFSKTRDFEIVDVYNFQGKVGSKVIIYDDILDSGQTLIQICMALNLMHVQEIVVFVTHAFFHGAAWNDLWQLGVKILYCTDSTPQAYQINHPRVVVKSIVPLLKKIV